MTAQHSTTPTIQHSTTRIPEKTSIVPYPFPHPLYEMHKCERAPVAPKQDSLCSMCACELFWLINILSRSVTCDRLYGKKTARPRKHLKEAFYLNPSRYRAEARKTHERAFYSNASCYRAHARNTSGQWYSAATFCYKAKAERSCPELYCILLVRLWCI